MEYPTYEITSADKQRMKQISDAWSAHDGSFTEQLPMMVPSGINPNANSNRIEPIVTTGVNFAAGKPVQFVVAKDAPTEAQDFLDGVWGRDEKRMPLIQDVFMSGAIAGQAYIRIVPNQRAIAAINAGMRDPLAKIFLRAVDPMTVYVQKSAKDCKTVMLYCIEYSTLQYFGNNNPQRIYYREEIQRIDPDGESALGMPDDDDTWIMQYWVRVGDHGAWLPDGDTIKWPFSFAPIFSCQNRSEPHDFYGRADATPDLIQQNDDINLNQSNAQAVTTIYADPLIVGVGVGEAPIDRVIGCMIQVPEGSDIHGVPLQTDLSNNLTFTSSLRANMDEQSGVPAVALGRQEALPKGQISGVTMELLFLPMTAKTEMKRSRYGGMFIDVSEALLLMAGFVNVTVSIQWQSSMPHDDLASWQTVPFQIQAGVSKATILREHGYDPGEEQAIAQSEAAQQLTNFSRGVGMPPAMPVAQQQEQVA